MCKYCKADIGNMEMFDNNRTSIDIWKTAKHWALDITIDGFTEVINEPMVEINYCPMCGRKLSE